jgi:acetyl esterase/lipase
MKQKLYFLSLIFICAFHTIAQTQTTYKTITRIPYRILNSQIANEYERESCWLEIYFPENIEHFTTIIWFHGGGLTSGEALVPEELKNQNIAIIAVNYRLSPKAKCPDYIEDAAAATAWVFNNIGKYGGDTHKIYISGHSAGGYLASMIGLDKKWLADYNIDADSIAGIIPFSCQTITHFTIRKEQGIADTQPIVDKYAPLFHVRPNAPPLVLITGDREMELLGRYEENAYLWRMMKIAGHTQTYLYELDGFDHVEMAKPAFGLLLKYIRGQLIKI